MRQLKPIVLLLTIVLFSSFTAFELIGFKVKGQDYAVNFKGKRVEGAFKGLKANISFNEANPEQSKIIASIDVNTINTGSGMKDGHAKSDNALGAEKYPTITFESSSVVKKGAGYEATGKLTIKGVTKVIQMPFTYENKGNEGVFKGHFSIVPADYNITRMGTPDNIDVDLNVPVTK